MITINSLSGTSFIYPEEIIQVSEPTPIQEALSVNGEMMWVYELLIHTSNLTHIIQGSRTELESTKQTIIQQVLKHASK